MQDLMWNASGLASICCCWDALASDLCHKSRNQINQSIKQASKQASNQLKHELHEMLSIICALSNSGDRPFLRLIRLRKGRQEAKMVLLITLMLLARISKRTKIWKTGKGLAFLADNGLFPLFLAIPLSVPCQKGRLRVLASPEAVMRNACTAGEKHLLLLLGCNSH